jgi:hypothetical protein
MGQLLCAYNNLKNLGPDTLYSVTNYSLAVNYTAWLYWGKQSRRHKQVLSVKSRTKWHVPVRKLATEFHTSKPGKSAAAATRWIIENKPVDLKLPQYSEVYDFVRLVFNELDGNS